MPELPEVETTRLGLLPYLRGQKIRALIVRERRLRWQVPEFLPERLSGRTIHNIGRRGKYLLFDCHDGNESGHLLIHLGMSGSLRILDRPLRPGKHDHLDIVLENGLRLRYTDSRRFGAMLWIDGAVEAHPLLKGLGCEPLSNDFTPDYLFQASRGKRAAIKQFLMNSHIVTGIGNIYANEALYHAGIHPSRATGSVSRQRYARLVQSIRETLKRAIKAGGSSIRDYVGSTGETGHFQLECCVYGREGLPCRRCAATIRGMRHGQRSSFYCPRCQR
jgi:formamidopyrimidine-DNA glycosylase